MIVVKRNVLLNGQCGPACDPTVSPQTGTPAAGALNFPRHSGHALWTNYAILVQSLQGAPSAATVTFGFELAMETSHGDTIPQASPGTYTYTFTDAAPQWQAVTFNDYPDLFPDGPFPGTVADQTIAAQVMLTRRIKGNGMPHRLRADLTFTGGTNPGFLMTVISFAAYEVG